MSGNNAPVDGSITAVEEIDFSKYRTAELVEQVASLGDLPKSLGKLVATIVVCVVLTMAVIYAAFRIDGQNPFAILLTQGYGLLASLLFAIALWLVMLVRQSLATLTKIVDLILEATARTAADYSQLSKGEGKLPPMSKLVGAVYEHLFMNVFRETVSTSVGFLGQPIYWAYRLTIDRMLRQVIRFIESRTVSESDQAQMKSFVDETLPHVAENQAEMVAGVEVARNKIASSSDWLSSRILLPCYAIIALLFVLFALPIVAVLLLG